MIFREASVFVSRVSSHIQMCIRDSPKLASFAFGLVADVMLVLAFYHLARLLYGKPRPAALAFFSAVSITMSASDIGGIGLSCLMGGLSLIHICFPQSLQVQMICGKIARHRKNDRK